MIFTAKMSLFFSGNIFVNFSKFHRYRLPSFLSADVGNQLRVGPNAMVADAGTCQDSLSMQDGQWRLVRRQN